MVPKEVVVVPWDEEEAPSERRIRERMQADGLRPYRWSNEPGDEYAAHTHPYPKVLYVVRGVITFELPDQGEVVELAPGDCMELAAGVRHSASVGPRGVVCLEAHR